MAYHSSAGGEEMGKQDVGGEEGREREREYHSSAGGEEMGKQDFGRVDQQQQESPYTPFKSNEDYVRAGYGGEGYEPALPAKEQQPDYYSPIAPPPSTARDHGHTPSHHDEGGVKERVFGSCLGGHPHPHDDGGDALPHDNDGGAHSHVGDPHSKPSLLAKVKDKLSPN